MHFIAQYKEKAGAGEIRAKWRPDHVKYRTDLGAKMVMAGPLLSTDGQTSIGSYMVFEAGDYAGAEKIAAGDPLVREGAFDTPAVTALRIVAFNAPAKG
jgi:uncharacterized protein YciI